MHLGNILLIILVGCVAKSDRKISNLDSGVILNDTLRSNSKGIRTIHVFVALCDNKYQGIVPVPAKIGNGQDAANNLYWGAAYGVKNYFKSKSKDWQLIKSFIPGNFILERLLFKHKHQPVYMIADAYDGRNIKNTTEDFLNSCAGNNPVSIPYLSDTLYFGGASNLLAYTGHDGLMDFTLDEKFQRKDNQLRESIILACYSKKYFSPHLRFTGTEPLLWSTGLMAPEAYILHDAIEDWINGKDKTQIRRSAAKAYSKYQKCSQRAAEALLVTGW